MKGFFKGFIFFAALLAALGLSSCNKDSKDVRSSNGFKYSVDGNEATIISAKDKKSLVIPQSLNGYTVTAIDEYAFGGSLEQVTLPKTIVRMNENAFKGTYGLSVVKYNGSINDWLNIRFANASSNPLYNAEELYINESLDLEEASYKKVTSLEFDSNAKKIGNYQFYGLDGVTSIKVNNHLSYLGDYAFGYMTNLKNVTIKDVDLIGEALFSGCSSLEDLTLPYVGSKAYKIGDNNQYPFGYLFGTNEYENSSEVYQSELNYEEGNFKSYFSHIYYIPNNLTRVEVLGGELIPDTSFEYCSMIKEVVLGDSIKRIGASAFTKMQYLKSITLGSGLESVQSEAFDKSFGSYDINLKSIYYNGTIEDWCNITFSNEESNPMDRASDFYIKDNYGNINKDDIKYILLNELVIPDSIEEIKKYQFLGCKGIESVVIGSNVKKIGYEAFYGCSDLITVDLSQSKVEEIERYAFASSSLLSIKLPSTLTTIQNSAFSYCKRLVEIYNLSSIDLENDEESGNILDCAIAIHTNASEKSIINYTEDFIYLEFEGAYTYLRPLSKSLDCILPENILGHEYSIASYAFYQSDITSLNTGGATSIGDYAFAYCYSLKNVVISENVEEIGKCAFDETSLDILFLGSNVTHVGSSAFGTNDIVYYNSTIDDWGMISFESFASNPAYNSFKIYMLNENGNIEYNNSSFDAVLEVHIKEGITSIGANQYINLMDLNTVYLPSTLTSIGEDAFSRCYKLAEIYNLSEIELEIGSDDNGGIAYYADTISTDTNTPSMFYKCGDYIFKSSSNGKALVNYIGDEKNLVLPSNEGEYILGDYLFYHNKNIKSVVLNEYVTAIGDRVFSDCDNLESVLSADSVTSIGLQAFQYCKKLLEFELPTKLTSIGRGAFYSCESLKEITIPSCVKELQNSAFSGCSSIKKITFNEGLEVIGNSAFSGCYALEGDLVLPSTVKEIADYAFMACWGLDRVYINDGCESIGKQAFYNLRYTSLIYIPSSVTTIGEDAFVGTYCFSIILGTGVTNLSASSTFNWGYVDIYSLATTPGEGGAAEQILTNANWYYFTPNGKNEKRKGSWWYYDESNSIVTIIGK